MNDLEVRALVWYDPYTVDTYMLAEEAYGIKVKAAVPTGYENELMVVVQGPKENVSRLAYDIDEDCIDFLEDKRDMSDNEYMDWLSEALKKFGVLYIPAYEKEDDDED